MPSSMAGASNSGARTAKSDGVSTSITGDKTRDKCMEMLYDALALESGFRMSLFCVLGVLCRPHLNPNRRYLHNTQRPTSYCNVLA